MGSREDDAYWNNKYWDLAPECDLHGDTQYFNAESGEWECYDCVDEEDMQNG